MDMNCLTRQFNYIKVVIAIALQIWSGVIIPDPHPPCCIVRNQTAPSENKSVMDPAHGWMKVKAGYALTLLLQDMEEKQLRPGVDYRVPEVYNGMKTFNEWITKRVDGLEDLSTAGKDLGCVTKDQDESIVMNQLEQLVDRVAGVLHYAAEGRRDALIEKFIHDVRNKV